MIIGRVPRYSKAFCIPAVFCCTNEPADSTVFSTHPRTSPTPVQNLSKPVPSPSNAEFHPELTVSAV